LRPKGMHVGKNGDLVALTSFSPARFNWAQHFQILGQTFQGAGWDLYHALLHGEKPMTLM
jgi:hypothetical protein